MLLLACLETGPVPAYSHALEGRSGPRNLRKYRVLAHAPPRLYVGVVLLLSDPRGFDGTARRQTTQVATPS